MKMFRFLLLATALLASFIDHAGAETYYVAANGSDRNDGSKETPFASIQRAADVVNPGDTVIVRNGTYTDTDNNDVIVYLNRGGTAEEWIVFRAENKWGAILDGRNNTTSYGWSFGPNARYVRVEDFEIKGCATGGFWSNSNSQYIYIYGNHIHQIGRRQTTSAYGLAGIYQGSQATHHVYDSNVWHDIGRLPQGHIFDHNHDHGIYIVGDHSKIINNVFYKHEAGWAIQVTASGSNFPENIEIINNTFADPNPGRDGQIILHGQIKSVIIQNNIFLNPHKHAVQSSSSANKHNVIIRNNLTTASQIVGTDAETFEIHDNLVGTDPKLPSAETRDFHLQANSPAIDAGNSLLAPAHDMEGKPRPIGNGYDIGAYEFEDATSSLTEPTVQDVKFTRVDESQEHGQIYNDLWYDLYVYLDDPQGWDDLAYADVWLSHESYAEGSVSNRGGAFLAQRNYVMSYSIATGEIWVRETEGRHDWTNLSGKSGLYIDDETGQYEQQSQEKWAKARIKLLEQAQPGEWTVSAYVRDTENNISELFQKSFTVISATDSLPTAAVSLSARSPIGSGTLQVNLTTSKKVIVLPTPLILEDSQRSIFTIDLHGALPGSSFTGSLVIDERISDGLGRFVLPEDVLVAENGLKGNEITDGGEVLIDKTPPSKPQIIKAILR